MFIEEKERSNQTRRWEAESRVLLGDFFFFSFFYYFISSRLNLPKWTNAEGKKKKKLKGRGGGQKLE